ncbi:Bifunctional inhibitor/lipid-transfer protein/seed storage 2S albumin protein [Dioscorea alata]|uniref:Bifunctional inhibitor/lipid-transfer protein/seed storage 2S albumin protein n=2 Tax=Dioscorea alata TaxID=55571 RepID=A0ACB7UM71_DIOAL|nr:Bifunctional inhibitor/lipid-transfer protein/seed storage 2S albumin protein [Dioscorea alata]KAH7661510.1 Bifunctional inhibitor/lipid-transfer protein/seed storage 2S albumin protein [Dioscorea alata]
MVIVLESEGHYGHTKKSRECDGDQTHLLLLILILLSVFRPSAYPPPPASSSSMPCTDELVAISPCLPTVAEDSDDDKTAPSTSCCANFFAAVDGTWSGPACVCHLIHEPILLGFPFNASLFVSCARSTSDAKNFSDLCRGIQRLSFFHTVIKCISNHALYLE